MLLKINISFEGDTLHARLAGEFDIGAVDDFREAIEYSETPWRRAVVDLADIVFMDSSALGALVSLNNRARERGLELTLARPSHPVMHLLQLTGLEDQFVVRS